MHNTEPSHLFTILAVASTGILIVLGLVSERISAKLTPSKAKLDGKNSEKHESPTAAANGHEKTNNALAFLQTAKNQASQAESACSRASSGPKSSRQAAAEQAHYHAQAAQEAAGNSTAAAAGGPVPAADAAAQARDVACRAQGAADRARYNAAAG